MLELLINLCPLWLVILHKLRKKLFVIDCRPPPHSSFTAGLLVSRMKDSAGHGSGSGQPSNRLLAHTATKGPYLDPRQFFVV